MCESEGQTIFLSFQNIQSATESVSRKAILQGVSATNTKVYSTAATLYCRIKPMIRLLITWSMSLLPLRLIRHPRSNSREKVSAGMRTRVKKPNSVLVKQSGVVHTTANVAVLLRSLRRLSRIAKDHENWTRIKENRGDNVSKNFWPKMSDRRTDHPIRLPPANWTLCAMRGNKTRISILLRSMGQMWTSLSNARLFSPKLFHAAKRLV